MWQSHLCHVLADQGIWDTPWNVSVSVSQFRKNNSTTYLGSSLEEHWAALRGGEMLSRIRAAPEGLP